MASQSLACCGASIVARRCWRCWASAQLNYRRQPYALRHALPPAGPQTPRVSSPATFTACSSFSSAPRVSSGTSPNAGRAAVPTFATNPRSASGRISPPPPPSPRREPPGTAKPKVPGSRPRGDEEPPAAAGERTGGAGRGPHPGSGRAAGRGRPPPPRKQTAEEGQGQGRRGQQLTQGKQMGLGSTWKPGAQPTISSAATQQAPRQAAGVGPQPSNARLAGGMGPAGRHPAGQPGQATQDAPQQQHQQPLLHALLRVVGPLEAAGYAYWAVRRTAAWLHGVELPLPLLSPQGTSALPRTSAPAQSAAPSALSPSGPSQLTAASRPQAAAPFSQLAAAAEPGRSASRDAACALGADSGGSGGGGSDAELPYHGLPPPPAAGAADLEGSEAPLEMGADLDLDAASPATDLEVEVQWDQLKTVHELFGRPGSGWRTSAVRQLPGGRAYFTLLAAATAADGPAASPAGATAKDDDVGSGPPPPPVVPFVGQTASGVVAARELGVGASALPEDDRALRQPGAVAGSSAGPAAAMATSAVACVRVRVSCTYNTVLRANPARVAITPRPPPLPPTPSPVAACEAGQEPQQQGAAAAAGGAAEAAPGVSLLRVLTDRGGVEAGPASESVSGGAGRALPPQVWAQSLYSVAVEAERSGDRALTAAVRNSMARMQRELSAHNTAAWGRDTAYTAWVARFGPPAEAAERLLRDPGRCLGPLLPYLQLHDSPPLRGLAAANLLGSHGHKAVALAALGARVAVADASAGNAAYATQLAEEAGVGGAVSYTVCDVAELAATLAAASPATRKGLAQGAPAEGPGDPELRDPEAAPSSAPLPPPPLVPGAFDLVLMEMGVLHYFLDLRTLMRDVVAPLLRPGGRFLLREFHPVSTKLVASKGKKHKVAGDYFATQPLVAVDVAFSKYEEESAAMAAAAAGATAPAEGPDGDCTTAPAASSSNSASGPRPQVLLRRWGLGEVVSAVAGRDGGGLRLLLLDEEPGARLDDAGLPKVFTLLAEKGD